MGTKKNYANVHVNAIPVKATNDLKYQPQVYAKIQTSQQFQRPGKIHIKNR